MFLFAKPSRHVLFVDASSTRIAGRKTSFGTRTTSPLSFILRRWVSWRLPRRDSHPRSPRTEPSVATRPEVLVFHPISPLTWPFHRSYQTSRPRFSARARSLLHEKIYCHQSSSLHFLRRFSMKYLASWLEECL